MTRELVVISGKGGVGKTTISASLAYYLYSNNINFIAADADVDTPSLKLLLPIEKIIDRNEIKISKKALIDYSKCNKCHECIKYCNYGAIILDEKGYPKIINYMCEGCGVCKLVCPNNAISLIETKTGELIKAITKYGFPLVTAQLEVGEHNSGLLVGAVKNEAGKVAEKKNAEYILIDGAPGIGCPVIAALLGASYALIIIEPTPQSLQGAIRVKGVADHFKVPVGAIINKYDISNYTEKVKEILKINNINLIGEVPLDYEVLKAVANRMPILEYNTNSKASKALLNSFKILMEEIL